MRRRGPSTDLVPTRTASPVIVAAGATPTLAQLAPRFLVWLKLVRGRSENTVRAYGLDLSRFLEFCGRAGIEAPDQVTTEAVEAYIVWIRAEHGAAPATANRHRYALVTFWRWLRKSKLTTGDPVGDTFPLKQPARLPKGLSIAEADRVIEVLGRDDSLIGRRDLAAVATGLLAGLRVEELATLKVHDIDFEAGTLRVIGKGDKEREIPIVPRLAAILHDYLEKTRPALVARPLGAVRRMSRSPYWGGVYVKDGRRVSRTTRTRSEAEARAIVAREADQPPEAPWLFVNASRTNTARLKRGGQALLTRSIFRLVRLKVSVIVGRPVSPHALRHSFASRLRENGAPLELIQEGLGHASINTTLIYARISTAKRKNDLARYLDGAVV